MRSDGRNKKGVKELRGNSVGDGFVDKMSFDFPIKGIPAYPQAPGCLLFIPPTFFQHIDQQAFLMFGQTGLIEGYLVTT